MTDFSSFGLPEALTQTLTQMGFTTPTPIQEQAIPLAMAGQDILGSAQTGTGKTGAFGIPMVAKLLQSPIGGGLVLTPTRELAAQVHEAIKKMLGRSHITTALLIGGESMGKQFAQLRTRPRIIVATPGRLNDHLARGNVMLKQTTMLVLDETDRMLDMGFGVQIDRIVSQMSAQRQTWLFSATLPHNITQLSSKYLNNPARVAVGAANTPTKAITQEVLNVQESEKFGTLVTQLNKREGSVIIFVKTKRGADRLAEKLAKMDHGAKAIHGDLNQRQRDRVILGFRNKEHRILVATDVAARGLDVPHIEHVINYDLPQAPEDYIHRIGRTARAGAEGFALCLITSEDGAKWRAIQRLLDPNDKGGYASENRDSGNRGGSRGGSRHGDRHRGQGNSRPFSRGRNHASRPEEQRFDRPERAERRTEHTDGNRAFEPRREDGQRNQWEHGERREGSERNFNRQPRREGQRFVRPEHRPERTERRTEQANGNHAFEPRREGSNREGGERNFNSQPRREGERREGGFRSERRTGDRPAGDRPRSPRPANGNAFQGNRDGNRSEGRRDGGASVPRRRPRPAA